MEVKNRVIVGLKYIYIYDQDESLPTSSLAPTVAVPFAGGLILVLPKVGLVPSYSDESAVLRLFSAGEELEEVLRLRRPGGA